MNNTTKKKATRSSLACLPCRSQHIKCDGNKPSCTRCIEAAKQCDYPRSRRGGLDREALAERRKRLAAANSISDQTPSSIRESHNSISEDVSNNSGSLLDAVEEAFIAPSLSHTINIEDDGLVDSYYNNFHNFHPFLLPRRYMVKLYRDPNRQSSLAPLIATMRFVGHIYRSQEWDMKLKNHLEVCFRETSPTDPVVVQSRLLYSIALFWYDYKTEAASQMEVATRLAIDLGMFRREFATEHGAGDPVLEECWRRTWWMLYILEVFYAGTLGTKTFKVVNIEATVDLPYELMFQAHMVIHVATITLHRPLSDLKFNSVESISSCARDPPSNTPTPELVNIHTVRVLRSVEAQVRLLTLPVRKFAHTPFATCMVSEGTLALLSACNFIFRGKELATAREQIRLIIGCLKVLGEVWPRIARNVGEIQTIAQHVLGLGSKVAVSTGTGNTPDTGEIPVLSAGEEQYDIGAFDIVPLESIDDLCGFYNLPSLDFNV
ncbi:hypothetical protein ZTR_08691 [Talaromyces verruculosus]|nr:hypothetical protein ZTR_08691 [Talaromyces verruculosus]